ncbi:MAG: lytic murein transglycosylase, partial [Sulfurimonadaceae bacterium]|nr:lytic murein transglycosylase [Sulfurimonadaceae bacterium]
MKYLLLLTLTLTSLLAKHDNCTFKNPHYEEICKNVTKSGVSYEYANKFLLSYFKTQKFDEITWKYIQPKHITTHKKNEKKANNVLVKYIPEIVTHIKEYDAVYNYAETKYGVNREIIAAILMKETKLGKIVPQHDAFLVFNTMVVRTKGETPREQWLLKMGKSNMASIIKYCYKKNLIPEQCNLPSSYAGAVGIPQFMPDSFIYARGYKNEVPDLTKMEDAIVSIAHFLHAKASFDVLIDWAQIPHMPEIESAWYEYEFVHEN